MYRRCTNAFLLGALCLCLWTISGASRAQDVPDDEQLRQLLAPIALYPDTLLAQICAASGDPQQILDADAWLNRNGGLSGQALIDAAQGQGFDPAIVALVTFPTVLDAMAKNVDDYAAIGAAFKANQAAVTSAIQALRQQAYASGALDSNQYQTVSVEQQNGAQVVVIQPANPQVVYVPQYVPQQVFVSAPYPGDVLAASLIGFGAGIAIGVLINNQPWGWHSWGWGWYGRGVYYRSGPWHPSYRYRSPHPPYRPRPPVYNRPGYGPGWGRPPPNWNQRPGYRPPPGGYRPPPGGNRPGTPGTGRPPGNGGNFPGNGGGSRPPGGGGANPPGNGGGSRPPGNGGNTRPAPIARPAQPNRNPYAGFPQGGSGAQRPTPSQPTTGARPSALGGNNNGRAERAASSRGRASTGGAAAAGGRHR
ncbi:MAG TPA: DUF3300 domain-containing protein [Steroidobacteraceae bacterium]|jgi:hypothetical protein